MKIVSKIIVVTLLMAAGSPIVAQSKIGTTAANFLTIPVGPRASGMGGAFVATADDATDAFWNAAGLTHLLDDHTLMASHADWLVGTSLNWFAIAVRIDQDDALALSLNQLDYGKTPITTPDAPGGTGQDWTAQDIAVGASYARNLTDQFSIGGTFKFIDEQIWNESSTAFALDVGLLFNTGFNGIRLGMNIANFGTEMQMNGKDLLQPIDLTPGQTGGNSNLVGSLGTNSWSLPLVFTVGLGMDMMKTDAIVWSSDVDVLYPNNAGSYLNLGTELTWNHLLSLRAGYNSLFEQSAEEGASLGVGLEYNLGGLETHIDYSYMDFGIFNDVSRFSLSIGF
ncbi:MAG: PorV/PorQ family protein [Bacteroidota bacterium]